MRNAYELIGVVSPFVTHKKTTIHAVQNNELLSLISLEEQ